MEVFDNRQHENQVLMNHKKSRKLRLREFHEKLTRDNVNYNLAVLYDQNIKEYNKSQVYEILTKKKRRLDFWTKKQIVEARFERFGSL